MLVNEILALVGVRRLDKLFKITKHCCVLSLLQLLGQVHTTVHQLDLRIDL
jgi:hypothetical protein